ncbi:MAG: hypothetical protein CMM32_06870 [Rhodospirillaceae bacterium]|nr:hypothetical protein [Rhodospirillaceae bacterium]
MVFQARPQIGFLASGFVYVSISISIIGFLGFYSHREFITTPPIIVFATQLIALIAAATLSRKYLKTHIWGLMPFLCLALWSGLSVLWADQFLMSFKRWSIVFAPGILMLYALGTDQKPGQKFIFLVYLFSGIAIASLIYNLLIVTFGEMIPVLLLGCGLDGINGCHPGPGVFHSLAIGNFELSLLQGGRYFTALDLYLPRYSGITSNPNSVGLIASLALIGLVAKSEVGWRLKNLGPSIMFLLVLFSLILSGSRAAYLMTMVGVIMVLLLRYNWLRLSSGILCLVLLSPVYLYGTSILSHGTYSTFGGDFISLGERSSIWARSLQGVEESWKTGMGFGLIEEKLLSRPGYSSAAHSLPLTLLLETGIIGLILFIITWLRPVLKILGHSRDINSTTVGIASLLIALFVHQLFDSSIMRYHWLNFVFAALIGIALSIEKTVTSQIKIKEQITSV